MQRIQQLGLGLLLMVAATCAFSTAPPLSSSSRAILEKMPQRTAPLSATPDLDVVALVAGQENYGLAVVCVGEAIWSFLQAPSFDHAKILVPAALAAVILGVVSGPMITSGVAADVSTGLFIATGVSVGLGLSYVARLAAPFSPSSKEVAALGLLVAIAGFFSFSQNLVVDGFVTLPSIPFPEIKLPTTDWGDDISDQVSRAGFVDTEKVVESAAGNVVESTSTTEPITSAVESIGAAVGAE